MTCISALKSFLGFRITAQKKPTETRPVTTPPHVPMPSKVDTDALPEGATPKNMPPPAGEVHGVSDPMELICAACRAGFFSYEGFRKAILKDYEDLDPIDNEDELSQDEIDDGGNTDELDENENEGVGEPKDEDRDESEGDDGDNDDGEEGSDNESFGRRDDDNDDVAETNSNPHIGIEGGNDTGDMIVPNDTRFKYIYTTTWGTISKSVTNEGCNWCRLLIQNRDGLPDAKYPRGGPDEEVTIRIEIRIQSPVDWMDVTNNLYLYLNDYKAASYMIYAESGNVAAQEIGTGDHFRHDPSYVDYEKINEWLKKCSEHDRCSRVEETPLPTRVIDCSDPTKPRLALTQRRKGHFCALSYVWGGDQKEKTTMANLDSHINEGFKVALPQTIADAIFVTHNLGLQYLWVDALCIIQDSFEDKVTELANMAHIYQDAYVTLSVVSAFRADQGFLPDGREHVMLPYHVKEGEDSSKRVGRMLMKYYIPRQSAHLGYKHQTVEVHEPLRERGWCLQESTLPPRKLVFKPPNVEYECRTFLKDLTRVSEGGEDDGPPFEANVPPIFADSVKGTTANEGGEAEDLYDYWGRLLFDYTARKITVATDKLVAFSSVAEVFQKAFNDEYVAGLWRGRLIDGLLWDPFGDIGPDEVLLPRPKEYRAPTWSWASVDLSAQAHQQHMFEAPSTDYEAEIISCQVTPKSAVNPFGEISEARLTMKVKMHPLMLDGRKCRFTERKGVLSGDALQSLYVSGGWVAPDGNCLQSNGKTTNISRDESEVTFDCSEGSEQDCDMDFYVVMLRAGRKWGDRDEQPGWMMGLLVLKCEDEETYKRVAKVELHFLPDWFDTVSPKSITLI